MQLEWFNCEIHRNYGGANRTQTSVFFRALQIQFPTVIITLNKTFTNYLKMAFILKGRCPTEQWRLKSKTTLLEVYIEPTFYYDFSTEALRASKNGRPKDFQNTTRRVILRQRSHEVMMCGLKHLFYFLKLNIFKPSWVVKNWKVNVSAMHLNPIYLNVSNHT